MLPRTTEQPRQPCGMQARDSPDDHATCSLLRHATSEFLFLYSVACENLHWNCRNHRSPMGCSMWLLGCHLRSTSSATAGAGFGVHHWHTGAVVGWGADCYCQKGAGSLVGLRRGARDFGDANLSQDTKFGGVLTCETGARSRLTGHGARSAGRSRNVQKRSRYHRCSP